MSLYARSKPYQVLAPKTYQCDRCGIIRQRANFRSATPMGFARAVFAANHRPALEIAA